MLFRFLEQFDLIIELKKDFLTWTLLCLLTIWHTFLLLVFFLLIYDDSLEKKRMNFSSNFKDSLFYIVSWYALLVNTVLLLPFFELSLSNAYCSTDSFALYECWSGFFWAPFFISVFNCVTLVSVALGFSYVGYDTNPFISNQPYAQPPNKTPVLKCLAKLAFPVYSVIDFDNSLTKQAELVLLCIFLSMTFIHVEWTPVWNYALQRFFLFCDSLLIGVSLAMNAHAFLEFGNTERNVTIVLLLALYAPFIYGVQAFYTWHKKRHSKFLDIEKKEEDAITWTLQYIHEMLSKIESKYKKDNEMLVSECDKEMKILRMETMEYEADLFEIQFDDKWDDTESIRPYILMYYQVKKILLRHSASPILLLLSAMILKDKLGNPLKALSQVTLALVHKPSIEIELAISILKKQIEGSLTNSANEYEETSKLQIQLFYVYQQQFSLFQLHVMSALTCLKDFWVEFLERKPDPRKLQNLSKNVFKSSDIVIEDFRDLELLKPGQVKTLSIFYKFARDILNQKDIARTVNLELASAQIRDLEIERARNHVNDASSRVEGVESQSKTNFFLSKDLQFMNMFERKEVVYFTVSGDDKNIGTILDVNKEVKKTLGFKKSDLVQGNLKMIMPWIYGDIHDGFLREFVSKSEHKSTNAVRFVFPLNKGGFICPLTLHICVYSSIENGLKLLGFLYHNLLSSRSPTSQYYILYHAENGFIFGFTENLKSDFGMTLKVVVDRGTSTADFGIETFFPDINKLSFQTKLTSPFGTNILFTSEPLSAEIGFANEQGAGGNATGDESEGETLVGMGESDGSQMNSTQFGKCFHKAMVTAKITNADSNPDSPIRFISFKISDDRGVNPNNEEEEEPKPHQKSKRDLSQSPVMAQSELLSPGQEEKQEKKKQGVISEEERESSHDNKEEEEENEESQSADKRDEVVGDPLASSSVSSKNDENMENGSMIKKEETHNSTESFYEKLRTKRIPKVIRALQGLIVIFFVFLLLGPVSVFLYKRSLFHDYFLNIYSNRNYQERTYYMLSLLFYTSKMRAIAIYDKEAKGFGGIDMDNQFESEDIEAETRANITELSELFDDSVDLGIKDAILHGNFSAYLDARIDLIVMLQDGQASALSGLTLTEALFKFETAISLILQSELGEFYFYEGASITDTTKELYFLRKNGFGSLLDACRGVSSDFEEHTTSQLEEARDNIMFVLAGSLMSVILSMIFFLPMISFIFNRNKLIFSLLAKTDIQEIKEIIQGFNKFYVYLDLDDEVKDDLIQSNEGMFFASNSQTGSQTPPENRSLFSSLKAKAKEDNQSNLSFGQRGAQKNSKIAKTLVKNGAKQRHKKTIGRKISFDEDEKLNTLENGNSNVFRGVQKNMARVRSLISKDRSEYIKKSVNHAKIFSFFVFFCFTLLFVSYQLYTFFTFYTVLLEQKVFVTQYIGFLSFKSTRMLLIALAYDNIVSSESKTDEELALIEETIQKMFESFEIIYDEVEESIGSESSTISFRKAFFEMQYGNVCDFIESGSSAYSGCSKIASEVLTKGSVISLGSLFTKTLSLLRELPSDGRPLTTSEALDYLTSEVIYNSEAINLRVGISEDDIIDELEMAMESKASNDETIQIVFLAFYLVIWAVGFVGMWKKWGGQLIATVRMMQRILIFVPRRLVRKKEEVFRIIGKKVILK